jgi:hypothetical protein
MRRSWTIKALAALMLLAGGQSALVGQEPASPRAEQRFGAEIDRLYRIDPASLRRESTRDAISRRLDSFWNRVKADRATLAPLLRSELGREGHPPFFYFDGARLLREASESRDDRAFALTVLERADLTIVDPSGYLLELNWYSSNGYDTRRAALRWLDMPRSDETVTVMLLPHIFHYSRIQAFTFSLFGMDEQAFVGDLIARLQTERDDLGIAVLIHSIWAAATPDGRAALAAYAGNESKPEAARRGARELLAHRGDGPPSGESEAELRRQRRAVIANAFEHGSFQRFHALTDELLKIAED